MEELKVPKYTDELKVPKSSEESKSKVPRMESIPITAKIHGLPVNLVRQKVLSGEVPAIRAGRKILVNVDKFTEYLNNTKLTPEPDEAASSSRITPIDLRR